MQVELRIGDLDLSLTKGEEEIAETTKAYERVADEIAALCPETIIITSPHSIMYADWFHISPGGRAAGSFASFSFI